MPNAVTNGTGIHYEDEGAGSPVFLLFNGNGGTTRTWPELAEGLTRISRVIRHDYRGTGRSQTDVPPFSLETLATDAVEILDHLGVERAVLVGHAFGGRVAQVVARDHPKRVAALVLCGTGGQFPPLLGDDLRVRPGGEELDRQAWEADLLARHCAPGFAERQPDRARRVLDRWWEERDPAASRRLNAAARATPSPAYWGSASAPALLLYGTEDRYGHAQNAHDLDARLPDSRLVFIPEAGHLAVCEQPERLLDEIETFIEERRP